MNCQQCGTSLKNGEMFCPNCGAKIEVPVSDNRTDGLAASVPPTGASAADPRKKKNTIIVICVVAVFVLLLALLGILLSGNGAKDVTKEYYKAIETGNASKLLDTVPKDYIEELADDYDLSKKEIKSAVQDYLDDYYNDYDDIRVSFKDKDIMDADDFAEEMMVDTDEDFNIKKAVEFELKVRYKSDGGDTVKTKNEEFIVFKYKGGWYSMDAMFLVTMAVYTA